MLQRRADPLLRQLEVDDVPGEEPVVGAEVEVTVPGQASHDHLRFSGLPAALGFLHHRREGVRRLWCRDDPLGAGKPQPGLEALPLKPRLSLDQPQLVDCLLYTSPSPRD